MISLHPYLRNSGSVVALLARAEERGIPMKVRIKSRPKKGILVGWGARNPAYVLPDGMLNHPATLHNMTDKLRFFKHVGRDSGLVPDWTDSEHDAREWGDTIVARYKTGGSGGEGISIHEVGSAAEFPHGAPLYTRYQRKTHEYRCHVFRREGGFSVGCTQRKAARRNDAGVAEVKNWQVRNLENGFVFVKNDGQPVPERVTEVAVEFMQKYFPEMDFCALDIIYHKPTNLALVLEGNTAPGLEGSNLDLYIDYFQERLQAA